MMGQAPFGHDRATTRNDAGDALGGHRHIGQPYAGMDGEVIDALLGLLDQGVAKDFPGQVLGATIDLLQRLIKRHGTDRHRRVAQDPLTSLVDVLAGGQVHDGVTAQRIPQTIFSTSSAMLEVTAELPRLPLTLVRKFRPMIIGSLSGWLMFAGMIARPRAISSRTNSGVISSGIDAPKDSPLCWRKSF